MKFNSGFQIVLTASVSISSFYILPLSVQAHDLCPTLGDWLDPFKTCNHNHFEGTSPKKSPLLRTRWENGPKSNFTTTSPEKWIENDGSGSSFTETARNSEYIEIYDASRDFYLRLKDRGFCFKNPGDPNWHCGDGGRWTR